MVVQIGMRDGETGLRDMLRRTILIIIIVLTLSAVPAVAYAFNETTSTVITNPINNETCGSCHPNIAEPPSYNFALFVGPHGGYTTTSSKCASCHSVHAAPQDSILLLPGATLTETCLTCHDGTQGRGVYGAIAARLGGGAVTSGHSVDTTNVVPGGDANTGGSTTMTFAGVGNTLACSDCHSVHAANVVEPFLGDRLRSSSMPIAVPTNKLLKQLPGAATEPVTEYGSDWCLGCHQGRASDLSTVHNHPAESAGTTDTPFTYGYIARLVSDDPTSETEISETDFLNGPPWGGLGGSNRGYLMPYPRTPEQEGHDPICQQCHEDSRDVGALTGDGSVGDAAPFSPSVDGASDTANPRFQNFPHESTNRKLLVETDDDLCLNCHPLGALP